MVAPKQNFREKTLKTPRFPDVFGGLLQQVDQLLRSPFGRCGDERRFLHPNGFLLDKFGRFGRNLVSWYFLGCFVKFEITVATCFFSNLSGVNQDPPREPKADLMHEAQGLCNVFLYHFKPVSILCLSLVPSSNAYSSLHCSKISFSPFSLHPCNGRRAAEAVEVSWFICFLFFLLGCMNCV